MNAVFADTFYFIALINSKDPAHQLVIDFSQQYRAQLVTTSCVLTELADGLAETHNRH
jgi:predicted nucleic acid-binding protein